MPPRPPTRPPSPTNSPTTSQEPGACACDNQTIKDPNCLNCANDQFGCLGCQACGVEDCRFGPFSQLFSGFVGLGNTLTSPVELPIHKLSKTSALDIQISPCLVFQMIFLYSFYHESFMAAHIYLPHGDHLPLPGPLPPVVNTRASGDGRRHRHHDRCPPVR